MNIIKHPDWILFLGIPDFLARFFMNAHLYCDLLGLLVEIVLVLACT